MKLFLAGLGTTHPIKFYFEHQLFPIYLLESFVYLKPEILTFPNWNVDNFLLDSGAFTYMTSQKDQTQRIDWDEFIEKYARAINQYGIKHFFELDIDTVVGLRTVERLRDKLEALTGRQCIPVWHLSRGEAYWDEMLERYDYVAIGGLVSNEIKPMHHPVMLPLLRRAIQAGKRVHGLGFTAPKSLRNYPFYSVDSTSWASGNRYGRVYKFSGTGLAQYDRPRDRKRLEYKSLGKHNLTEWLKYQAYADKHL